MKITREQIERLNPCEPGFKWYCKNASHIEDLEDLLLFINAYKSEWSRWLFIILMTLDQQREIALFAAEQVLPTFESRYPSDTRVRDCINALKDYKNGKITIDELREMRRAADAAATSYASYAAYAADAAAAATAYAADAYAASYAAATAYAASYTADAASYTADATAYAADAADAADAAADAAATAYAADAYAADARKEMQERIIKKAVEILEGKNEDN